MRQWKDREEGRGKRALRLLTQIALIAVTALFCVTYLGFQVKVEGRSMAPAIEPDSTVLVNRISICFFEPSRFDTVAFWQGASETEQGERDDLGGESRIFVKYVVGLPGETIQIRDGKIWIDSVSIDAEPYLDSISVAGLAEQPITLGEDEYFVLGANSGSSEDSRFATIGNVKKEQIIGKVWFRFHSFTDMSFI